MNVAIWGVNTGWTILLLLASVFLGMSLCLSNKWIFILLKTASFHLYFVKGLLYITYKHIHVILYIMFLPYKKKGNIIPLWLNLTLPLYSILDLLKKIFPFPHTLPTLCVTDILFHNYVLKSGPIHILWKILTSWD